MKEVTGVALINDEDDAHFGASTSAPVSYWDDESQESSSHL